MARSKKRRRKYTLKPSRLTPTQRKEYWRVLSTIGSLGQERGTQAENRAEEALCVLNDTGILQFERSKPRSEKDYRGIDFKIWGKPPNNFHFTIDVKSSKVGVAKVRAESKRRNRKHHYPLLVQAGDSVEKVIDRILTISYKE